MPRNFFRRIEAVFPIEDRALRERVISELLAISLADNRQVLAASSQRRICPPPALRRSAPPQSIRIPHPARRCCETRTRRSGKTRARR